MKYLAVYGTLKQGFSNHHCLAESKCVFSGFTEIPYKMYQQFGIPWLVPAEKKHQIYVEVYQVSKKTLKRINQLEASYQKTRIKIDAINEKAIIYIKETNLEGKPVESGKFHR